MNSTDGDDDESTRCRLEAALEQAKKRMRQVDRELQETQRQLVETEKGPGATAEGYVAWWPKSFEIEYGPLPHYVPPPPKARDQSDGAGSSGRGNKRARRSEEEGDQRLADATPRDAQGKGNPEGSDTAKGKGKGGKAKGKGDARAGPESKGGKEKVFQYGNYPRYYQYRVSNVFPGGQDPRLGLFKRAWFEGKDMLDIGCHCGDFTLAAAQHLGCRSVLGIEIDGGLVRQAREAAKLNFPGIQAVFMCESFMDTAHPTAPLYDVVMCLSVTKWIHFNWGDDGVKALFAKAFAFLRPGGVFILEPQPWKSYKAKYAWKEEWKKNYHAIELKPGLFKHHLVGDVGFESFEMLTAGLEGSEGFKQKREVYAFHKGRAQ